MQKSSLTSAAAATAEQTHESERESKKVPPIPFVGKLVVGGVAGVIGTLAIFPLDMSKTRLQNQKVVRVCM